jgi:hypothetical protein
MAMPDPILHQLASAVEKARAFEQLVGGRHLSRTLNFFIEESAHQIGGWFHGCGGEETDIPFNSTESAALDACVRTLC